MMRAYEHEGLAAVLSVWTQSHLGYTRIQGTLESYRERRAFIAYPLASRSRLTAHHETI